MADKFLDFPLLAQEDDKTSNACIRAFYPSSAFRDVAEAETASILKRDAEDDEKLAKGIQMGIQKGVLSQEVAVEPTMKVDVSGKNADQVSNEIISRMATIRSNLQGPGRIIILQGLSGTGKGTTVALLKTKLTNVTCWSNGNVFRSLTLLAVKYCEKNRKQFSASLLTPELLAQFMGMLHFGKFGGKYDIKIDGLGLKYFVSDIANTVLKGPAIGKNIPSVAELTQGEVIKFAASACEALCQGGHCVIMEGRAQTLNYVRSPYRFELTLPNPQLIGLRRAAQQIIGSAVRRIRSPGNEKSTHRPLLICGPSGCGKGTLVNRLMTDFPDIFGFSVSHTSRPPRPGEVDGVAYHFRSREKIQSEIAVGKFLEHADVYGKIYGTSFKAVNDVAEAGKICIIEIDVQGAQSVKRSSLDPHYLFVMPPSLSVLEARLRGRGTESEEQIQKRMSEASIEMTYGNGTTEGEPNFETKLVNDDLDVAYAELKRQIEDWYPHVSKVAVMDELTASLAELAAENGVGIQPQGEIATAQYARNEVTIMAGQKLCLPIPVIVPPNYCIDVFHTIKEEGLDIGFQVRWAWHKDLVYPHLTESMSKRVRIIPDGARAAELAIVFSNEHSWIRGKTLSYDVRVVPASGEELLEQKRREDRKEAQKRAAKQAEAAAMVADSAAVPPKAPATDLPV